MFGREIDLFGVTEQELLSVAVAIERSSDHPLATAIMRDGAARLGDVAIPQAEAVESITGKGIQGRIDGTVVQIAVADQGVGVASPDIERIFRPFVQGHASVGVASGGVGLGLAICRRIVSAHGGHIEAVPDVGHGLFRVTLPSER